MGISYVFHRSTYELRRKSGFLKKQFPSDIKISSFISLEDWQKTAPSFFFDSRKDILLEKTKNEALEKRVKEIKDGVFTFFFSTKFSLSTDFDWITNPSTGYKYKRDQHWTEIEDIVLEAGDIKYVWEPSRFVWLYDLIRYDYHYETDSSKFIFTQIDSWIDNNPINCGPNYKCSQEMAIRILNWTFALYFYKYSSNLSDQLFKKISHSIRWQLKHIYKNINFSRKTVRNNHAMTETLCLYLGGTLFPFFPEAKEMKLKGKKWFEEEVCYQIYPDGTHLLFSTNYQRVVIQLLTWGAILGEKNQDKFSDEVYNRMYNSLNFLYQMHNKSDGRLPNYGPNDGSLNCFLSNTDFRDFRPQINTLHYYLTKEYLFKGQEFEEEAQWLTQGLNKNKVKFQPLTLKHIQSFSDGGFYINRDEDTLTFIRCGKHIDRPSHADNLHIDLWYKGFNVLRDAGTYKYNTSQDLVRYFNGTKAHNTVALGEFDQMKKGPRFIWLDWSQAKNAKIKSLPNDVIFEGTISAFRHLQADITHTRKVIKNKETIAWEVEDIVQHKTALPIKQYWNVSKEFEELFTIEAVDNNGHLLKPKRTTGYYSSCYSEKTDTSVIVFSTLTNRIRTKIQLK